MCRYLMPAKIDACTLLDSMKFTLDLLQKNDPNKIEPLIRAYYEGFSSFVKQNESGNRLREHSNNCQKEELLRLIKELIELLPNKYDTEVSKDLSDDLEAYGIEMFNIDYSNEEGEEYD